MSALATDVDDVLIISDDVLIISDDRSRRSAPHAEGGERSAGKWPQASWASDVARVPGRHHTRSPRVLAFGVSGNLHQVGLALHQYHEAHGQLPAPASIGRDGTKLLSWRVAILPYLGHQSLYERFHPDEPWDSPHNLLLVAEMPREFGCPGGRGRRAGKTSYMVIVGPEMDAYSINTAFEPTRGAALHHVTDGTSNSLLVLETDVMVPWTKPDDLQWCKVGRSLRWRALTPVEHIYSFATQQSGS